MELLALGIATAVAVVEPGQSNARLSVAGSTLLNVWKFQSGVRLRRDAPVQINDGPAMTPTKKPMS